MGVTSMRISTTPRPKPQRGDRKVIKGVLHERQFKRVYNQRGESIGYDCTGGRQRYVWVPVPQDGTA